MRLIDADALIEKSLKDANCYMDNNDIKHGYHNVQCLIYDAPTIDAVPRWIPCEERLPEEYGCYLITTNDGSVDLALFGDTKDEKAWSSCDANGFYWLPLRGIEVVAWMPLPEPYKGERKDDD